MTLSGLPGTSGESIEAAVFYTVSSAMILLQGHRAITTAGEWGAINAWIDDDGNTRAELMQRMVTRKRYEGKTKAGLRAWLKEHLPTLKSVGGKG